MSLEKFRNKLIVFESPDHSGKSTIATMLNDHLNNNGISSIMTKQPGDIRYGKHADFMNQLCKGKEYDLDPLSNLFAFLLDRSEQTSKIVEPALESKQTVISDRWWYSTIAYQFYGKNLLEKYNMHENFAFWMNQLASHFYEPDIVFYMKRPKKLIESTEDNPNDLFETQDNSFKNRVAYAYNEMVKNNKLFRVISVDEDPEITFKRVLEVQI